MGTYYRVKENLIRQLRKEMTHDEIEWVISCGNQFRARYDKTYNMIAVVEPSAPCGLMFRHNEVEQILISDE